MCRVRSAAFSLPRLGFPEGYVPKDRREATWNLHWCSFHHSYSMLFCIISYYFMIYHTMSYFFILFHITVCYNTCSTISCYVMLFHIIAYSVCLDPSFHVYGWGDPCPDVARWTPFIGRSVLRECPQPAAVESQHLPRVLHGVALCLTRM